MKIGIRTKFIIIACISGVIALVGFSFSFGVVKNYIGNREVESVRLFMSEFRNEVGVELESYKDDIRFLAKTQEMQALFSVDPQDIRSEHGDLVEQAEDMLDVFAKQHGEYFQLRYIDASGQEIAKVSREHNGSKVQIVPANELQNKKDSYYFKQTLGLSGDGVYVSEMDLNVEFGEIQLPPVPVIRFAVPVADKNGENRGIVIANVFAQQILDLFSRGEYPHTSLLDQDGYYLYHSDDSSVEWGKYLGTDIKQDDFADHAVEYQSAFRSDAFVSRTGTHHVGEPAGRNFYYKVNYFDSSPEKYWVISVFLEDSDLFSEYNNLQYRLLLFNGIVLGAIVVVFLFFTTWILRPIRIISRTIERLNTGKYDMLAEVSTKDEFKDFADKLNSLIKKVRESDKEQYDLVKSASHQLRTPASVVRMNLDLLEESLKASKQYKKNIEFLDNIENGNIQVIKIVGDITKYLELGEGYFATHLKRVNLRAMVENIVQSLSEGIRKHKLSVTVDVPKELTPLIEEDSIKIAILQIISNAVEYSNDGGEIAVQAKKVKGYIQFQVSDTGIGIPEQDQLQIFSKFFRAENAYAKKNVGTGLGLAIAKIIVEGHGGKISFTSKKDRGTTFIFTIFDPS